MLNEKLAGDKLGEVKVCVCVCVCVCVYVRIESRSVCVCLTSVYTEGWALNYA